MAPAAGAFTGFGMGAPLLHESCTTNRLEPVLESIAVATCPEERITARGHDTRTRAANCRPETPRDDMVASLVTSLLPNPAVKTMPTVPKCLAKRDQCPSVLFSHIALPADRQ